MERDDISLTFPGCVGCGTKNILNLSNKKADKVNFGGELSILESTLKDRRGLNIYCSSGDLLCLLCKFMAFQGDIEENEVIHEPYFNQFFDIFYQAHMDLRTSLFLVICGHHRASKQVMRSAYENIIMGGYLALVDEDNIDDQDIDEQTVKDSIKVFKKFRKGKFHFKRKRIKEVAKRLESIIDLPIDQKKKFLDVYDQFCQYIHPNPYGYAIYCEKDGCVFSLEYDEEYVINWYKDFQYLVFMFIVIFINCFVYDIKQFLDTNPEVGDRIDLILDRVEESEEQIFLIDPLKDIINELIHIN